MSGELRFSPAATAGDSSAAPAADWAERLESGDIVLFPQCPFPIPQGEDADFLRSLHLRSRHKSIVWEPNSGRRGGFPRQPQAAERLQRLLDQFGQEAAAWLAHLLPDYCRNWQPERICFHPEEEATRALRLSARNDLIHLDTFPRRPSQGWRLLRLFVNLNPSDPRVWVTSDPFPILLEKYGPVVGLPRHGENSLPQRLRHRLLRLFQPHRSPASVYDRFMRRLHHYLKQNEEFQERCRKRLWYFPPGAVWLAFTDYVSHAVLRGQYALERTFFVAPDVLRHPEQAPVALLQRVSGVTLYHRRSA
jgi:hypothetical protein